MGVQDITLKAARFRRLLEGFVVVSLVIQVHAVKPRKSLCEFVHHPKKRVASIRFLNDGTVDVRRIKSGIDGGTRYAVLSKCPNILPVHNNCPWNAIERYVFRRIKLGDVIRACLGLDTIVGKDK